MKVAVTGGSGVVGRAVLRHLVEAGHEVRALARSDDSAERVSQLGAEAVRGDVLDEAGLTDLVGGSEWVFHVAGVNEMCSSDPRLMDRVNIEGTRNVMEVCRRAAVGRMVHTSSAVTIGEEHGTIGSESSLHRGAYISRYEKSKHLAEQLLFREAADLDVVAVNPSSVQGPGRATGTGKLILDVVNGRMPLLMDTNLSIVDIDDCARGHLLAAERGERGERYILSGATIGMRQAVAMLERAVGRPLPTRYAPGWLVGLGAGVAGLGARLVGRKMRICREMVKVMLAGHSYDGTRATEELGLEYTPLEDTIERAIAWFETEGLL